MPTIKNRVQRITLIALSTAFLAACGGGDDSNPATPGAATAPPQTQNSTAGLSGSPGTAARSVTLTWNPPTQTTDGKPLSNLGGYRVYWGKEQGKYTESVAVDNAGLASYVVEQLAPARWHFAVTAVTTNGVESSYSNEYSTTIR